MPDYVRYLEEALDLLRQLVAARSSSGWPQWLVSLFSAIIGAALGFLIAYWKDRLKERRENKLLREGLYQEIANNYEAILHWTHPDRCDFEWLKQNIHQEITFLAYEAAGRSPGGFYRIPEHGWLIGVYRELRKLCTKCENANDNELKNLLNNAAVMIENGDVRLPATKDTLRSKLRPEYQGKIK